MKDIDGFLRFILQMVKGFHGILGYPNQKVDRVIAAIEKELHREEFIEEKRRAREESARRWEDMFGKNCGGGWGDCPVFRRVQALEKSFKQSKEEVLTPKGICFWDAIRREGDKHEN